MSTRDLFVSVVVPLLVGSLPALFAYLIGRRRVRVEERTIGADIAVKLTGAAGSLVDDLRQEILRLSDQNNHRGEHIEELEARVQELEARVQELETCVEGLKVENEALRLAGAD